LRDIHDELERRVAQRTAELMTANALLKKEIDEHKQAEQALLESNSLLRSVVEGTDDYIFAKDLNGRYLMVNSAAASFVGKPAEEIVGKNDMELFPPVIAQRLIEHDRQVIASVEMLTL
jgi:PAS domain-containing protein